MHSYLALNYIIVSLPQEEEETNVTLPDISAVTADSENISPRADQNSKSSECETNKSQGIYN